jgi:hypothetical protein
MSQGSSGLRTQRGCGVDQHECRSPLRIGSGEEHAERASVAETEDDCSLGPGRVNNSADVVHPRLERGCAGDAIRHTDPALVKPDQTAERSEPVEEASVR